MQLLALLLASSMVLSCAEQVGGQAAGKPAEPERLPRVLFLTHSAGFVHEVVKREKPEELAHAEKALLAMAKGRFEVTCTQDCARLEPAQLANYDAVAFYTTGELPIPAASRAAFLEWIRAGHAFVGIHCATDTLYEDAGYQQMIGGAFDGHPWHENVRVKVEQREHPAMKHLGEGFEITDEIYQFKNWSRAGMTVLCALDPSSIDATKGGRKDGDYALAWTKEVGKGRLFYTALGHRPEVWQDERFQKHLLGGLGWAIDESRKAVKKQ